MSFSTISNESIFARTHSRHYNACYSRTQWKSQIGPVGTTDSYDVRMKIHRV